MILKLKSFIQIGTFIFLKKFLTTRVAVNFIDETIYSTSIYHYVPHVGDQILENTLWGNGFY